MLLDVLNMHAEMERVYAEIERLRKLQLERLQQLFAPAPFENYTNFRPDPGLALQYHLFLTRRLEIINAVLALLGTVWGWTAALLLMEISFFNYHGTGRPPQLSQVQSMDLVSRFSFQLQMS